MPIDFPELENILIKWNNHLNNHSLSKNQTTRHYHNSIENSLNNCYILEVVHLIKKINIKNIQIVENIEPIRHNSQFSNNTNIKINLNNSKI